MEEPESIELDSDNGDNDDDDDASVTDVAHPYFSAGGLQSWMDATDKTATGTGGDDASARSDIAPASVAAKLLPSAMDMQVACTVEDESASSGRLHGWRCDSCNFVSSGLSSTCELCSAERGDIPCTVSHSAQEREQRTSAGVDTCADTAAQDSDTWLEHARDDGGISIDLTGASDSPGVSGQMVASWPQRNDSAGTAAVASSEPKHQKKKKRRRVEIEVAPTEPVIPTVTVTSAMPARQQQPVRVSSSSSSSAALAALGTCYVQGCQAVATETCSGPVDCDWGGFKGGCDGRFCRDHITAKTDPFCCKSGHQCPKHQDKCVCCCCCECSCCC